MHKRSRIFGQADALVFAYITMSMSLIADAKLNIVAIKSPPFVCNELFPCAPAIKRAPETGQGAPGCLYDGIKTQTGECVHGYLIDLLQALSAPKAGNFSYSLWLTTWSVTGGYNNLVREVFSPGSVLSSPLCGNSSCDIAIGDITVNWHRRRIANSRFSTPYMTTGLQILGRTKEPTRSSMNFDFMMPFTPRLWILILSTLIFFTFAIVFVEAPNFRSKFAYCRPQSSELSWQEKSISRYCML
jgi:hypothetical protein